MIWPMFVFSLSMSISPGPVNLMTLMSSLNRGFNKTFAFVSGATIGFVALLLLIGVGLHSVINEFSVVQSILPLVCAAYFLYLSFTIVRATQAYGSPDKVARGFWHGALMQWINPKAWLACMAGVSAYSAGQEWSALITFAAIYFVVCYVSIALWALLGSTLNNWISSKSVRKAFHYSIAGLLFVASIQLIYDNSSVLFTG